MYPETVSGLEINYYQKPFKDYPCFLALIVAEKNGEYFRFRFARMALFFVNSKGVAAIRQNKGFEHTKHSTSKTAIPPNRVKSVPSVAEWNNTLRKPTVLPTMSSVKL